MGSRKNISVEHFDKTIQELKNALKEEQRRHHEEMTTLIRYLKDDLQKEKSKGSKLADKLAMLTSQIATLKKTSRNATILAENN